MTEKHPPPSTQTALPTQSLPPLNPVSSAPIPKAFSEQYNSLPPSSAAASATATASPTPHASTISTHPRDVATPKEESAAEEEPYTIKCICGFTGDDGNTIYCEICDSWQHIECFYPNNSEEATREEFAHACHDCKPRPLDRQRAADYQKRRIQEVSAEAAVNHKPKRPPSKNQSHSHKKKSKPSDLQIHGHGHGHSASMSDIPRHAIPSHDTTNHTQPKKPKPSHKSSQSVGGSHPKRSPSYSASRAAMHPGHPLSPATTPPDLPDGADAYYSPDFLSLYNNHQVAVNFVTTNTFVSLAVSNKTSIWPREPERMLSETGHKFDDVFQPLPFNIDAIRSKPHVEAKTRSLGQGSVAQWMCLASSMAVDKDAPLMELNGEIGFQNDYCANPANLYEELSCPLPFVFFHPLLPLYIDTRKEGSNARYVRRSCRPNAILDTYLTTGSQYQFWLVSDRRIAPEEQITLPWDFRLPHGAKARILRLLGLTDEDMASHEDININEDEFHNIARWISSVLSRYGGCACDLGAECAFVRFQRQYGVKAQHVSNTQSASSAGHTKKKGSRKSKSHALSPTSTGHATNSRAASEGHLDEFPETDKLSAASRSKPPSRDMTPAPRQGSFDTLGILTEPTDRDKRKVAMVEDSFRRLEQQPRKKKRLSDGTTTTEKSSTSTSTSTKSKSKSSSRHAADQADLSSNRQYVDAGTSRSKSGSPDSAVSPLAASTNGHTGFASLPSAVGSASSVSRHTSSGPPPIYCDVSTQTDAGEEANPTEPEWWFSDIPPTPRPKRRIVSLAKRLLNNRFRAPPAGSQRCASPTSSVPPVPSLPSSMEIGKGDGKKEENGIAAPADTKVNTAAGDQSAKEDAHMTDAPMPPPTVTKTEPALAEGVDLNLPIKKSPDLRVQLPKAPPFSDASLAAGASSTPLSASAIVQPPFALGSVNPFGIPAATPSPIKKKMSLSDYTKSRKAAAGRPSIGGGTTLKTSASTLDESKPASNAEAASTDEAVAGTDKPSDNTEASLTDNAPPATTST
ncbi:phd-finger domain-containing protein [Ophiostoma piceae UAMH 11346]|uniref:Phd-finger domain-containing protein n=1 Tax=Ophiostoma piceae (strain UAMH 11346) TaxID=1262450 RepID=S3C8V2_OPHP1|nr:phd-finger domain-containing protein [Ophiostoma piceae UAMH 11346]